MLAAYASPDIAWRLYRGPWAQGTGECSGECAWHGSLTYLWREAARLGAVALTVCRPAGPQLLAMSDAEAGAVPTRRGIAGTKDIEKDHARLCGCSRWHPAEQEWWRH